MFGRYTKFIVAALGAVLIIINATVSFTHGQAHTVFTSVVAGVSALLVYLAPNSTRSG